MDIKNYEDLQVAILELEDKEKRQKHQMVANFNAFKESMTPMNLLKSTFTKVKETPGITGSVLKAGVGLGVGFLSKKLLLGKSPGFLRKMIGSAVQMGITGLVAKKTDTIKSTGTQILKNVFRSRRSNGIK